MSEVAATFDQYWNAPVALPIQAFVPAKLGPQCLAEVNSRLEKLRPEAKNSVYAQKMRESVLLAQVRKQRCRSSGARMKHSRMRPANPC